MHLRKSNKFFFNLAAYYFSEVKFQVLQYRMEPMKTNNKTNPKTFKLNQIYKPFVTKQKLKFLFSV